MGIYTFHIYMLWVLLSNFKSTDRYLRELWLDNTVKKQAKPTQRYNYYSTFWWGELFQSPPAVQRLATVNLWVSFNLHD